MTATTTPDPLANLFPIRVGEVLGVQVLRDEDAVRLVVSAAGVIVVKELPCAWARDLGELLLEAAGGGR